MFRRNANNSIIELELNGVEDNKDLFFFLVDLFCKGLVLLFGNNNKVEVENLTMDDFNVVKQKMSLAGVNVVLNIVPMEAEEEVNDVDDNSNNNKEEDETAPDDIEPINNYVNINDLEKEPNNKSLKDYVFRLKLSNLIYNINFELSHS
jgi:hypothetical protein